MKATKTRIELALRILIDTNLIKPEHEHLFEVYSAVQLAKLENTTVEESKALWKDYDTVICFSDYPDYCFFRGENYSDKELKEKIIRFYPLQTNLELERALNSIHYTDEIAQELSETKTVTPETRAVEPQTSEQRIELKNRHLIKLVKIECEGALKYIENFYQEIISGSLKINALADNVNKSGEDIMIKSEKKDLYTCLLRFAKSSATDTYKIKMIKEELVKYTTKVIDSALYISNSGNSEERKRMARLNATAQFIKEVSHIINVKY